MIKTQKKICSSCYRVGTEKSHQKGSTGIEAALWIGAVIWYMLYYYPTSLGSILPVEAVDAFLEGFPSGNILALFALIAIIYTVWRIVTTYKGCPRCASPNLLGINTPQGKRLYEAMTKEREY